MFHGFEGYLYFVYHRGEEKSVLWRYNEHEKVVLVRDVFCRFARVLSRMGLRVAGNSSAVCSWTVWSTTLNDQSFRVDRERRPWVTGVNGEQRALFPVGRRTPRA